MMGAKSQMKNGAKVHLVFEGGASYSLSTTKEKA